MADVFISYSSKHRALTERLALYLSGKGLSVWWDDALEARGPFAPQIHSALQKAGCVIVIWTTDAIVSEWVNFEANEAFSRNKLINVEPSGIDRARLPDRFRDHHRHVQSDARPVDFEKIFSEYLAVRDGKPLSPVVPERKQYEKDYDELLLDTKRLTPLAELSVSPSTLLQAKYGFVAFADFHGLKTRLIDWAEGRGAEGRKRAVAGYLVHGAGGTGKTRLMIEVAAELRERGWSAGFLNPHAQSDNDDKRKRRSSALAHLINGGDDAGLMIILDYAEDRRPEVRTLALQMAEAAKRDPTRPRILILLVREIGEWWDNLRSDEPLLETVFSSGRLGGTAEISITKAISEDERLALFSVARQAFSKELARVFDINGEPPSAKQLLRISSDSDYDRPLAILMAALLDVCAEADTENESSIAVLLDQILRLERGHWLKVLPELDDVQRREMASGTVQVTLVGGTTARSDTVRLLNSDPYYGVPSNSAQETGVSGAVGDTVARLSRFYGNGLGGLTGLEPDLVGEHMIVAEASWRFPQIQELVKSCLLWDNGQRAQWRHVLTVLNRATKSDHGTKAKHAAAFLNYVIRHYAVDFAPLLVDVALAEPDGQLPETMAATAQELGDDDIEAIDSSLPEITVRLMDVVLVFAQRLVALRMAALSGAEQSTSSIDDKIGARTGAINALNSLSVSLANLHRHDEALATSEQAVSLCRTFERSSPEPFRRILVKCLISLGAALNALHRQNEALRVMQEGIELNRVMAAANPREFLPSLAMSLANLGTFLSQGGHSIDALSASEEALSLYGKLNIEKPGAFDYEFSGTLINLSSSLADVDRRADALAVAEEAVATVRKLARDRPDEFVPALAKAVGALGLRLLAVDRNVDAIAAATEVCTIYRSLVTDRPRQFLSGLAHGLKDSGVMLLRCGKKMESLDALHESCSLYGELVLQRPDDFLPELALALGARSDTLSSLDRHREAAESASEGLAAVLSMLPKIEETLGSQDKAKWPPALLHRVRMLASTYIEACQRADVGADLGILQHAAHLLGGSMDDIPRDLKISLDSKLVLMRKSDRPKAIDWGIAKAAGQHLDEGRFSEAEALFQELLVECGETYGVHPYTATILGSIAETVHKAGRSDEGEMLARQSLEMFERCLGKFHPDVASQRGNLAGLLSDENKLEEAEALYSEAIRCLEADVSTETQTRLAVALHGLTGVLRSRGKFAEAARTSRRHLDILIDASRRGGRPHPLLEKAFNAYGSCLSALGNPRDEIMKLLNDLGKGVGVSFGTKG